MSIEHLEPSQLELVSVQSVEDAARYVLGARLGLTTDQIDVLDLLELANMASSRIRALECKLAWLSPSSSPHD